MDNKRFTIVKDLPMPKGRKSAGRGRGSIYPFKEMEIGDCLKFIAKNTEDTEYRKIYNSARSHTKRSECDYDFRFARLDEEDNMFGCWKVQKIEGGEEKRIRRRRRTAKEIESIPLEELINAFKTEGTLAGASRRVGLSPKTFLRLTKKLGLKKEIKQR